ncbi:MAG: CHAT domain-containing protein, partial [Planctomycetota bacterium]
MQARLSILATTLLCECPKGEERIPLTDETLDQMARWAGAYRQAVRNGDATALAPLGTDLFAWLDGAGWASAWWRGSGPRGLEIAVDDPRGAEARALLDLPWEILVCRGEFLAADATQPFVVFRSIGRPRDGRPAPALYRDFALMFMASAPRGRRELNFEAEEAAILQATERLPVQVVVEESGCAEFLADRLAQDGPFEAVHLSCHGDLVEGDRSVLALETPEGDVAVATPGDVAGVLGDRKAPLVFLSACRTAEGGGNEATEPFARELIRAGVPNVLGWDGSVYDPDATAFAGTLYGELAKHASVPYAAAMARAALLRSYLNDPDTGRHWHLARIYAGKAGAGPCCDRGKKKRRLRRNAGFKAFLDAANRRGPVAAADEFVGRRRRAQDILRVFNSADAPGVLIHGMGDLGKSSLAARIANRMPGHKTVLIYEDYDAPAVFERLLAAVPPAKRETWERTWRESIRNNGAKLADALEAMLEGPPGETPMLLIVDDLEQILEKPGPDHTITPVADAAGSADAWRISLSAILRAFGAAETDSRLLLTSRYDFTCPDGKGADLSATLKRVQLKPMESGERVKQWRAAARKAEREAKREIDVDAERVGRAVALARGNPGLQAILCRPILSGETAVAAKAMDAVEAWWQTGEVPADDNAAGEFFQRVSFQTYSEALTADQRTQLRAATLFSEDIPIPLAALEAAGTALGAKDAAAGLTRLIGLGLVDTWGRINAVEHAAVNPLARPLVDALSDAEMNKLATAAMAPLAKAWADEDGDFPRSPLSVEAAWLALHGGVDAAMIDAAAVAAGSYLFYDEHDARKALVFLKAALAKLDAQGEEARPAFFLLAANCAERVGKMDFRTALLERAIRLESDDKATVAWCRVLHAETMSGRDGPERAMNVLREATALYEQIGLPRERAIALGKIADILQQRGETDEALRICREEELPVYERLGDVRSRAVTMGQIADILQQRAETDEALRIRREEQLPVYERLGDVRERAVTLGKIADILQQRGETDEALR